MPQEWTDNNIKDRAGQDTRRVFVHGLLLPVTVTFYRWKQAGEDKATEITEAEYLALKDSDGNITGGGEKVMFNMDLKAVNPGLQYSDWSKGTFRGFRDWLGIVQPGINDATGMKPPESTLEFNRRARSGKWYAEAEIITTTQKKDPSQTNQIPKFTRMTTDLNEVIGWAKERYGNAKSQATASKTVPQDLQDSAAVAWTRIAKKDISAFSQLLQKEGFEELKPYAPQLEQMASAGTLG